MTANLLNRITLVLAFVGVFIAGVLSVSHMKGYVPPCGIQHSCDEVLTSKWATPLGIPLAYVGLGVYAVLAALAIVRAIKGIGNSKNLIYVGYGIAAVGTIGSLALTYISVSEIKQVCYWCLASGATMTLTLIAYALMAQIDLGPETDRPPALIFDGAMAAVLFFSALIAVGVVDLHPPELSAPSIVDPDKISIDYVPTDAHIHGDPKAPVTIVEFGDLLCPACRVEYPKVIGYVDDSNGKIRAVFRHFPLKGREDHRMSLPAANIAEIASDHGKFWDFVSAMYKHEIGELQTPEALYDVAKSVGLDPDEIRKRLGDEKDPAFQRTLRDISVADQLDLKQTPTFLIMVPGMKTRVATVASLKIVLDSGPIQKVVHGGG